ncbi:MAG: polyribonucleotide nucleotidyltransferase [Dehalococcoidia bacterium]|nr:polyribonucleotide nucleotidyltransferase [Dehalococcoidia bacterium]
MESSSGEIAGRTISLETGELARRADGSITVRYGDTTVLVTACLAEEPRPEAGFVPLTIDYEERLYAAGKIPGSFIRREGRPSEEAVLAARLCDRVLRPLLPKTWDRDIQVVVTVLSVDQENEPDVLAVVGASAALCLSEIPFAGPVSATRVGYINEELVLNPTLPELEESALNLVVAGTDGAIVMIEGQARGVPETLVTRAIQLADGANREINTVQQELLRTFARTKLEVPAGPVNNVAVAAMFGTFAGKFGEALDQPEGSRMSALESLREELVEKLGKSFSTKEIDSAFEYVLRSEVRRRILDKRRPDGRTPEQIRPMSCRVGLIPRVHGSGLFNRGETQVLTITTLGSTRREQQLDGLGIEETKRFIHHYNFPPFAVGEVRRIGSPSRREIGHGALVERALEHVVPADDDYPYTIRLVSEVLASNGSTSMSSVCAGSLSLMDAGIPVKEAVAGVAMGLVMEEYGSAILTDIEGLEDAFGDMDFKVAGTADGITAMQMDTKLQGVSIEILLEAMRRAREARLHSLSIMRETISESRPDVSRHAPRMYRIKINPDKIGAVIGSGGKTIKSIISETRTTIDVQDDGTVLIGSPDSIAAERAIELVEALSSDPEVGRVYTGRVTRVMPFGAFVEIMPGKEGLVHISELATHRVRKVEDEVKVGDQVVVRLLEIDGGGRLTLSRRAVLETAEPVPARRSESR